MNDAIWTLRVIAWYTAQSGYITVGELAKETGCSESTARRRIKSLIESGIVMWRNRGEYALDGRDEFAHSIQTIYSGRNSNAGGSEHK